MTNFLKFAGVAIAGLVVGYLGSVALTPDNFAGLHNNVRVDFSEGISVDGTVIVDGSGNLTPVDGTFSGGQLTVTTAAGATSTVVVGGIQTYATSSATSICLFPSILGATSSFSGTMYWKYGTAPCQL